MKLSIYGIKESPFIFKNASPKRKWMNETFDKHAYRCVPLINANVYGWEVCLPHDVVVIKDEHGKVSIIEGEFFDKFKICSTDILNESIAFLHNLTFVTEKNYSILVSGPPNYFVDGAQSYTAIIPSSWWFNTFQFSWRITKTNCPILFKKNQPIMFISLIQNTLLSETDVIFEEKQENKITVFMSNYSEHVHKKKIQNKIWLSTMRGKGNINGIEFCYGLPSENPEPPKKIDNNENK